MVAMTVPAVTSSEMPAPTGNFVRFHASTKPSMLNGAGSEKALPSTAWPVVLNAIDIVTYSGSSTVTAHRIRMIVPDQLTRSMRTLGFLPEAGMVVSVCVDIRVRSFRGSARAAAGR